MVVATRAVVVALHPQVACDAYSIVQCSILLLFLRFVTVALFFFAAPSSFCSARKTIDCSDQGLSATLDYPILCRLAAHNPRLARLRLSRAGLCGVTSAGRGRRSLAGPRSLAMTLAAAPPRLVVLDVSRSFVDDSALDVIARGLENNRVLTNLILHGNDIGAQVRKWIRGYRIDGDGGAEGPDAATGFWTN